jgi:hypothetical protein
VKQLSVETVEIVIPVPDPALILQLTAHDFGLDLLAKS